MAHDLSQEHLSRLSTIVALTMGLHFPPERWSELRRGVSAAADDLGFDKAPDQCLRRLAETPALSPHQIQLLACHLTVGETYFFRERRHFDFLAERILPELIGRGDRRLRIWCAGCCTGEEAYSIAITLHRAIPDIKNWELTLLATDINPHFLRKAQVAKYGPWSFRGVPDGLRERYFLAKTDGMWEVRPEIRRLVQFAPLNLAEESYPSVTNDTHSMDVIFCRNVLMYFAPAQAKRAVERMYHAQREGGWLIMGSSELLQLSVSPYGMENTPVSMIHRKRSRASTSVRSSDGAGPGNPMIDAEAVRCDAAAAGIGSPSAGAEPELADVRKKAGALCASERHGVSADIAATWLASRPSEHPNADSLRLLARCLANAGQLDEALRRCDQALAIDRLNASGHQLRALILHEMGDAEGAADSLRTSLYIDPDYVLAHVTLGTAAFNRGQAHVAIKHLAHALEILRSSNGGHAATDTDGMTPLQLANMVHAMMPAEVMA